MTFTTIYFPTNLITFQLFACSVDSFSSFLLSFDRTRYLNTRAMHFASTRETKITKKKKKSVPQQMSTMPLQLSNLSSVIVPIFSSLRLFAFDLFSVAVFSSGLTPHHFQKERSFYSFILWPVRRRFAWINTPARRDRRCKSFGRRFRTRVDNNVSTNCAIDSTNESRKKTSNLVGNVSCTKKPEEAYIAPSRTAKKNGRKKCARNEWRVPLFIL